MSAIVAAAFRRLGVDARVGAVPGEYCSGAYSVNARGQRKLMGVGQRLFAAAAHVGGVVVVGDSERLREVLLPVYRALGLEWDPSTAGSVRDELGTVSYEAVERALVEEFARHHKLVETGISSDTLRTGRAMGTRTPFALATTAPTLRQRSRGRLNLVASSR